MPEANKPPVLFVMGPTASGKTDLALELFDHRPCRIISVDSALIYKSMNIGTAKPDQLTLANYPHALVDIKDPAESYSAADFVTDARVEIHAAISAGELPVLVGGTILYFKALAEGLAKLPEADSKLRAQIESDAKVLGWPEMHRRLSELDPASGERLKPTDSQRIQRALEVVRLTGRSIESFWREQEKLVLPWNIIPFALMPGDRSLLHSRIAQRFDLMLEQGFEAEVSSLMQRGDLHLDLPSMRSVGYRQMWLYLSDQFDRQTMREKAVIATRQLAKRQMTWLRGWQNAVIVDPFDKSLRPLDETLRQIKKASIY